MAGPAGSKQLEKTTVGGFTTYSGLLTDLTSSIPSIPGLPGLPGGGGSSNANGFLTPGTFSITGPGGPQVGAFTTSLTIGQPLTWSNQNALSAVTRANGFQVSWTGGDPSSLVFITGFSSTGSGSDAYNSSFTCYAKVSDGSFTVPSYVTLAMPASAVISGAPLGGVSVGSYTTPKTFTASGLDYGVATTTSTSTKTLAFN